ncbi:MAG: hypothetical protein U0942_15915 [Parvibaculum sp.]|uniref:hypothetical protein n=1 Tax=Parvibaculum sp. TaxID=2024848 RepID=UPI002ABA2CF9|nr:hypothetical protein [Parvibaculum sp.]MDZ4382818.1 hypothetical protein [Parvibaculum sp.]
MAQGFDLLGDPIPDNWGRKGRPPFMATEEKRRLVKTLLAFEWSLERIAAALNCTPPTVKKHFFRELKFREEARARVDAKLVASLMAEVEKGNVSAISKMFDRLEKHDQKVLADSYRHTKRDKPEAKAKPLGKKEQAKEAAKNVSGKFAPPAPPRLVN